MDDINVNTKTFLKLMFVDMIFILLNTPFNVNSQKFDPIIKLKQNIICQRIDRPIKLRIEMLQSDE